MAGEEITLYIFISGGFGDEISRRKSSGDLGQGYHTRTDGRQKTTVTLNEIFLSMFGVRDDWGLNRLVRNNSP
jgi:hypothetical protein